MVLLCRHLAACLRRWDYHLPQVHVFWMPFWDAWVRYAACLPPRQNLPPILCRTVPATSAAAPVHVTCTVPALAACGLPHCLPALFSGGTCHLHWFPAATMLQVYRRLTGMPACLPRYRHRTCCLLPLGFLSPYSGTAFTWNFCYLLLTHLPACWACLLGLPAVAALLLLRLRTCLHIDARSSVVPACLPPGRFTAPLPAACISPGSAVGLGYHQDA